MTSARKDLRKHRNLPEAAAQTGLKGRKKRLPKAAGPIIVPREWEKLAEAAAPIVPKGLRKSPREPP
jgi:hypothetical protein